MKLSLKLGCIAAVIPSALIAGTINLRSGSVTFDSILAGDGPVQLTGSRHFKLDGFAENARLDAVDCYFGCDPGQITSLFVYADGNDMPAVIELDGKTYDDVGGFDGPSFVLSFNGRARTPRAAKDHITRNVPVTYNMQFIHDNTTEIMKGPGVATIVWERYEGVWYIEKLTYKVRRK